MDMNKENPGNKHAIYLATRRAERRWNIREQRDAALARENMTEKFSVKRALLFFERGREKLMYWLSGTPT